MSVNPVGGPGEASVNLCLGACPKWRRDIPPAWAATLAAAVLAQLAGAVGARALSQPDHWLAPNLTVYSNDQSVVNLPVPGFTARQVPVANRYRGEVGGYVACYSHDLAVSAYRVSPDISVIGLVRLKGLYQGRIFRPQGYETADISALSRFKAICRRAFPVCRGDRCWAGGDTGGFVGE
jgi:hypothetical protein